MNKLKELIKLGWIFSACYKGNEFYLVATCGMPRITKSVSHSDLEIAMTKLYGECIEHYWQRETDDEWNEIRKR